MLIEVLVVPVAVHLASAEDPWEWLAGEVVAKEATALTYMGPEGWISTKPKPGESPTQAAQRLVAEFAPGLPQDSRPDPAQDRPQVRPVAFEDATGADRPHLRLVFTIPAPVSTPDLRPREQYKWRNLHTGIDGDQIAVRDMVRDYWRHRLEETTAAADFLPRYFTMGQLADTYRAIWDNSNLDWGNFKKWVTDHNSGMIMTVTEETVKRESTEAWESIMGPGSHLGAAAGLSLHTPALANTNRAAPAGAALAGATLAGAVALPILGPALLPVAASAGAIAYSQLRRGRTAQWYERNDGGEPKQLRNLYRPRPTWQQSELPELASTAAADPEKKTGRRGRQKGKGTA